MAAAARRDVGEDLAAAAGHKRGDGLRLSGHLRGAMFMILPDSTIMNVPADRAGVKVERQHPACSRAGIVDRDRARLARRVIREWPGVPRRVSASAVARDSDVRRAG